MDQPIQNKIASSGLVQLDLLEYKPKNMVVIDLKDQLWQELAMREKDLREWLKNENWEQFAQQPVCVYCSADAIIPPWVFMLVSGKLVNHTQNIFVGSPEQAMQHFWLANIKEIDTRLIENQRVVVKGCGDESVPAEIYAGFITTFQSKTAKIMYGEPCSTVPIYKRPKAQ